MDFDLSEEFSKLGFATEPSSQPPNELNETLAALKTEDTPKLSFAPLSVSHFAMYFERDCERFLNWSTHVSSREDSEKKLELLDAVMINTATLKGQPWEDKLINDLKEAGHVVHDIPRNETSVADTKAALLSLEAGGYVSQGMFEVPSSFYKWTDQQLPGFTFRRYIPDVIRCSKVRVEGSKTIKEFVVADIKAARRVKLYHKVQVSMYIMLLREQFRLWSTSELELLVEDRGEVWIKQADAKVEVSFDSAALQGLLNSFLFPAPETPTEVPGFVKILNMEKSAPSWHLDDFKCSGCDFLPICTDEAVRKRDVSMITRLSRLEKMFLKHLISKADKLDNKVDTKVVTDIEQLFELVHNPPANDPVAQLKLTQIKTRVDALHKNEVVATEAYSIDLSRIPHATVCVSLVKDPLLDELCAFRIALEQPGKGTVALESSVKDPSIGNGKALEDKLITLLNMIMETFQTANESAANNISAQFIVYDEAEYGILVDLLLSKYLAQSPVSLAAGQVLVSLLPHTSVLLSEDSSLMDVQGQTFPLFISLRSTLHSLLALPVENPTWTLLDWAHELGVDLKCVGDQQATNAEVLDFYALGARWHELRERSYSDFEKVLKKRSATVLGLFAALKNRLLAAGRLHVDCPRFSRPRQLDFGDDMLNRFAFVELYEDLIDFKDKFASRFLPREERFISGKAALLQYIGPKMKPDGTPTTTVHNFAILRCDDDAFWEDVDAMGVYPLLLSPASEEGEAKQHEFNDMAYADVTNPTGLPRAFTFAKLANSKAFHDNENVVELSIAGNRFIKPGTEYLAHLRYCSFNTSKLKAHLQTYKQSCITKGEFNKIDYKIPDEWKEAEIWKSLTDSKKHLIEKVASNSLQLVWGPPGTGKTHFLAALISLLIKTGKCRVLVTAFTKNATMQLLGKLVTYSDQLLWLGDKEPNIPASLKALESVKQKAAKEALLESTLSADVCIVGGTVWRIHKHLSKLDTRFDLVVVDEGTQLPVLPATIATALVSPTGRVVVVGDHLQIAPIRKGRYPEGQSYHSSIFHWLHKRLANTDAFGKLEENHRMNDEICSFTKQIYGSWHTPMPDIASRRVQFYLDPAAPEANILNSNASSIMIVLKFDPYTAYLPSPTGPEAKLTLRLAQAMLASETFNPKDVIICTPHRAQKLAIQAALVPNNTQIRIDTINRTQGQEAEAVIVSYGLMTPAMVDKEASFIYQLSMLNVATTRAKRKNIIIVPQYLLDHSFAVLSDESLMTTMGYLQHLRAGSKVIEVDVATNPLCM